MATMQAKSNTNMEAQHDIVAQLQGVLLQHRGTNAVAKVLKAAIKQLNWYKLITKGITYDEKRTIAVLTAHIESLQEEIESLHKTISGNSARENEYAQAYIQLMNDQANIRVKTDPLPRLKKSQF